MDDDIEWTLVRSSSTTGQHLLMHHGYYRGRDVYMETETIFHHGHPGKHDRIYYVADESDEWATEAGLRAALDERHMAAYRHG